MLARKISLVGYEAGKYAKITQVNQDLYVFDGDTRSLTCYSDINLLSGTNVKSKRNKPKHKRGIEFAISTFKE